MTLMRSFMSALTPRSRGAKKQGAAHGAPWSPRNEPASCKKLHPITSSSLRTVVTKEPPPPPPPSEDAFAEQGEGSEVKKQQVEEAVLRSRLPRSNSCGTLRVDSTLALPNVESIISALSARIHATIKKTKRKQQPKTKDPVFDGFEDGTTDHVSREEIRLFMTDIYRKSQLFMESLVTAGVLLERVLEKTRCTITGINWRRLVLSSLILASKLSDDESPLNSEWQYLDSKFQPRFINDLEGTLLRALDFKVIVTASAYAAFYFDLRSFSLANGEEQPQGLLKTALASRITRSHGGTIRQKDKLLLCSSTKMRRAAGRRVEDSALGYLGGEKSIEQLVNMAPLPTPPTAFYDHKRFFPDSDKEHVNICSPDVGTKNARRLPDNSSSGDGFLPRVQKYHLGRGDYCEPADDDGKKHHHRHHRRSVSGEQLTAICTPTHIGEENDAAAERSNIFPKMLF